MSRFLRYLRIAWSVVCGIACVLLIALQVRSYWRSEYISAWLPGRGLITAGSVNQRIVIQYYNAALLTDWGWGSQLESGKWSVHSDKFEYESSRVVEDGLSESPSDIAEIAGMPESDIFSFELHKRAGHIIIPHWLPVLTGVMFALLPWLPFRFSLRALLVGTTLVAVVLGLIVWAVR